MKRDFKVILSTARATRRTITRLANMIQTGEEEDYAKARLLHDIAKTALTAHKIEAELSYNDRLEAIERTLKDLQHERKG